MKVKHTLIIAFAMFISIVGAGVLIAGAIYLGNPDSALTARQNGAVYDENRTLIVSAVGSVEVEPDLAVLSLSYGCQDKSSANEAISEANISIQAAIDTLIQRGVSIKDIQTSGTSVYTSYYDPSSFSADGSLSVNVRDVNSLSNLLDAVVSLPYYKYSYYHFEVQDRKDAYEKAMAKAITEAKYKAEIIADDTGISLGEIISIDDSETYGVPLERAMYGGSGDSSAVMIGVTQVSAYIKLTYVIN